MSEYNNNADIKEGLLQGSREEKKLDEQVVDSFKVPKKPNLIAHVPREYWFFYRKPVNFLLLIISLIPGSISIVSHVFMGRMIDAINTDDALSAVYKYSLLLFLFTVTVSILNFISSVAWTRLSSRINIKVKTMLFKHFLTNSVTFFDSHPVGELITLLNTDSSRISDSFDIGKAFQLRNIGTITASFITVFAVDWRMGIALAVTFVAIAYFTRLFRNLAKLHQKPRFEKFSKLITLADEAISNFRIVSSFNRQKKEEERYCKLCESALNHQSLSQIYFDTSKATIDLAARTLMAVYLNFAPFYVLNKSISAGDVLSVIRALFMAALGVSNFLMDKKFDDSGDRVFGYLLKDPDMSIFEGKRLEQFKGEIEFKNVWFKYPTRDVWVLQDVSFKISPGEIVALVGHSGSGKSTVVQLLLRFYDVNEGEILLDGVNIKELNPCWIHEVVGVVQQDNQLFNMTVGQNIAYSKPSATMEEIDRAASIAKADGFIKKLPKKYDELVGEKGAQLSGGQRQRVAIARAVLDNPTILITDEATSALDAASEKKVQAALDTVMEGRTSIIVAHRLGTVRAAKKIFVFESGKLVESGTHEELISYDSAYKKLVQRQMENASSNQQE